jgi:hypothetical protein
MTDFPFMVSPSISLRADSSPVKETVS